MGALKRVDVLRAGYYLSTPVLLASMRLTSIALWIGRRGLRWASRTSPKAEAEVYRTMAEVYTLAEDPQAALEMLEASHRRSPMGDLNFRIALVHDACGNQAGAREYFKRALAEDSPDKIQAVRDIIDSRVRPRND